MGQVGIIHHLEVVEGIHWGVLPKMLCFTFNDILGRILLDECLILFGKREQE